MLWHVMHVLDCGKCEKVLLTTRGKWNVANRDELFVDLRRRRPLGLLETREAMLNCEEDGLLGCLNTMKVMGAQVAFLPLGGIKEDWTVAAVMIVVALAGKWIACWLTQKIYKMGGIERELMWLRYSHKGFRCFL